MLILKLIKVIYHINRSKEEKLHDRLNQCRRSETCLPRSSKLGIEENSLNLIRDICYKATCVYNSEKVAAFSLKFTANRGGCFCCVFQYCTLEVLVSAVRQKIGKMKAWKEESKLVFADDVSLTVL